jgi:hypothetical protein
MLNANFKPDLGIYVSKNAPDTETYIFGPVSLSTIARVDTGGYAATTGLEIDGQRFAATFDFDRKRLQDLLGLMPPVFQRRVRARLSKHQSKPCLVELPEIQCCLQCRLGEVTDGSYEVFIPFKVTEVTAPTGDPSGEGPIDGRAAHLN